MRTQRDIASFLVRFTQDLWRADNGDPKIQWRGTIRHVQGEEEAAFTDFTDAVRFIQGHLAQLTLNAIPGGNKMEQDKALQEGFKMWEQFAASYSKMMFDTMERTIQQSDAFRRQMDQAIQSTLHAWRAPTAQPLEQDEETAATIKDLNAQIQKLSKKIASLEKSMAENPPAESD